MADESEEKFEEIEEDETYNESDFSFTDKGLSDGQLDTLYQRGRFRLIQERNDFMLPQIVDYVRKEQWINTRPEYQRRLRWPRAKKSALIESFLMNVPVPPVFLYEKDINRYEVMDGQQRINSVIEFYNNEYTLSGLKTWPALNGKNYSRLPPKMRRGLDRAKISAHILLADSEQEEDQMEDIRTIVFDRLNTGGEKLNAQELRNALYSSNFTKMLMDASSDIRFTDIWNIPPHEENTDADGYPNSVLRNNSLYKSMRDCEIVLRFFAFQEDKNIVGSARRILDNCAMGNRFLGIEEVNALKEEFFAALDVAREIFGKDVFKLPENTAGRRILSRPLYDSLMVSIFRLKDSQKALVDEKNTIVRMLAAKLEDAEGYELIVGRANTAESIKNRISEITALLQESIANG